MFGHSARALFWIKNTLAVRAPLESDMYSGLLVRRMRDQQARCSTQATQVTGGLYFVIHLAATGIIASSSTDPASSVML